MNERQPLVPGPADPDGRSVQVEPIKPMLTALGTKRLKLKFGELLSSFAFKFNLRCYTMEQHRDDEQHRGMFFIVPGVAELIVLGYSQAGAYNRPLSGST